MQTVIVKKNVSGMGTDTENAAIFGTRFKFLPYSRITDSGTPEDRFIAEVAAIPGVVEANAYTHNGLYDLHVKKALAYDWDEIEPKITAILETRHEELSAALSGAIA